MAGSLEAGAEEIEVEPEVSVCLVPDTQDTIVAISSPPGPGARGIVRVTGLMTFAMIDAVRRPCRPLDRQRRRITGELRLPELHSLLPADAYVWPSPATYTGQDLAEIHTFASPPLIELLVAALLSAGCRAAQPGEFTMRAFLSGKLDLTRAEAVLGVIEAGSRDELRQALGQLAGGMARPLQALRNDLMDLLAEVEAGLDFAEEDIHFIAQTDLLNRLAKGMAQVTLLQKQLNERAAGGRAFRVVLAGRPNAGKSSLFNALAEAHALVSSEPGTTRDYLVRRLRIDDVTIELIDTAGWKESADVIESQAQGLGRTATEDADLIALCLPANQPIDDRELTLLAEKGPAALGVATKCDLSHAPANLLATSVVSGIGIGALRATLADRARTHFRPAVAPSLSRCRHHVEALLGHLRQAHACVLYEDPAEVLALELRNALDQLGEMVGAVYTDDLLDRIFSRFCIGK